MADKGTLFLDEFGEMSLGLQAKLLRVLQDGGIRRVGGAQIIRSMSHYCGNQRQSGRYGGTTSAARRSLLPHQCTFLTIPPLRERPQDISLLIRHFVQKYAKEFQRRIILDKACFDALHHHTWPGNVRELENTIIRLMLMAESDVITREELGW
jgi:transcriptional regulator of aroF, aroG, tyrA and aromatic amino acid transport